MAQSRRWHWLAIICLTASPAYAWYKPSAAHEAAIAQLMTNPEGAEAELSNTPSGTERLDYILFLHAFRPATAARDAKIHSLLAELKAEVEAKGDYFGKSDFSMQPYDGTDRSLIPSIQTASLANVVAFDNPGYAIPCGILKKRPALLEATAPQFGSSGDAFLPYSGCGLRGDVVGFPDKQLNAYVRKTGFVGNNENGTIRFSYQKNHALTLVRIKLNPRYFLSATYRDCSNHRVKQDLRSSFDDAKNALMTYYVEMGIPKKPAERAATIALWAIPAPAC
jgi:hypothetical protein